MTRSSSKNRGAKAKRRKPEKLEFVQPFLPVKEIRNGIVETSPYGQCTYPLCCGWATEDKNCYVVEFPNTLSNMETYNPINYLEAFREIKGCFIWSDITYDDYYEHRIPQRVYDNRFLIDTIISVYVYYSREQYGSLQPGFSVTPELLKIYRVDDGHLIAI